MSLWSKIFGKKKAIESISSRAAERPPERPPHKPVQKVPCSNCGVMILPSTAEQTGGLCARCAPRTLPHGPMLPTIDVVQPDSLAQELIVLPLEILAGAKDSPLVLELAATNLAAVQIAASWATRSSNHAHYHDELVREIGEAFGAAGDTDTATQIGSRSMAYGVLADLVEGSTEARLEGLIGNVTERFQQAIEEIAPNMTGEQAVFFVSSMLDLFKNSFKVTYDTVEEAWG